MRILDLWGVFVLLVAVRLPTTCATGTASTAMRYVIDSFESVDHIQLYADDNATSVELTSNNDTAYVGTGSLRLQWSDWEETTNIRVGFMSDTPYNCFHASSIRIWYKLILANSTMHNSTGSLGLSLWDASNCRSQDCDDLDLFVAPGVELMTSTTTDKWQEVVWDLTNHDASFWSTSNMTNKTIPDLRFIKGWDLVLSNNLSSGEILFDYLHCEGPGEMLGGGFWLDSYEDALSTGAWNQFYFDAPQAENASSVEFIGSGKMVMNYTVQQSASWGGFNVFDFFAPSFAYYNISGVDALSLEYNNIMPPTPEGHVHFRLILREAEECMKTPPRTCRSRSELENYYSFLYILDDESFPMFEELSLPPKEGARFSFTGWTGILGDKMFNPSYLKGFGLEFSAGGSLGEGNLAEGGVLEVGRLRTVQSNPDSMALKDTCIDEEHLTIVPKVGHVASFSSNCCDRCEASENCRYAVESKGKYRLCYTHSHPEQDQFILTNSEDESFTWYNDPSTAEICDLCHCLEFAKKVDCTGKNLTRVPEWNNTLSWAPTTLDLSENPELFVIGGGSLDSMSGSLQTIVLPDNLKFLSLRAVLNLRQLSIIQFESQNDAGKFESHPLMNVVSGDTDTYASVCCEKGDHVHLIDPAAGLSFCKMQKEPIGGDSDLLPFQYIVDASPYQHFDSSSTIMAEAAESPEMCVKYCSLFARCRYVYYDGRFGEAEPTCYFYDEKYVSTQGHKGERYYADEFNTIPGVYVGIPPMTRRDIDNAKVLISTPSLHFNPANDYKESFSVKLGANPKRGAVWVEPHIQDDFGLQITITPPSAVVYDNLTEVIFNIKIEPTSAGTKDNTLLLRNNISSCDTAFVVEDDVHVTLRVERHDSSATNLILIGSMMVLVVAMTAVVLSYRWKLQQAASAWKIDRSEILFGEDPVILGQGTFGLVLRGEFRGSDVAVKLVLPEKESPQQKTSFSAYHSCELKSQQDSGEVSSGIRTNDLTSKGFRTNDSSSKWSSKVNDFAREIEVVSKLRHPCITTILGAVPSKSSPLLVMELMEHGSLADILRNNTMPLDGDIIVPILRDITRGIRFLHMANPSIIHGDLKASNILVDERFRAKISDFGLSAKGSFGFTGTKLWMAPELLTGASKRSRETDVYSFGIVLYEVFSRREPFDERSDDIHDILEEIVDPKISLRPVMPQSSPIAIKSMAVDCWDHDPEKRPAFDEIDKRIQRLSLDQVAPFAERAARSIDLIKKIFPPHVAQALRDGTPVEADKKDAVAVFFSDIVGYTKLSSKLTPTKVIDLLDRLYTKLDEIAMEKGVFKIDVIGDAYMCATNLVEDQSADYAKRIAEFAIAAIEACSHVRVDPDSLDDECIQIRCGISIGPVVGRVVGTSSPKYSIFGDAVNVSSRMESSSKAGFIQCSEKAALLIAKQAPEIPLCCRGQIEIKGKGKMTTYFVNVEGERPSFGDESHTTLSPDVALTLERSKVSWRGGSGRKMYRFHSKKEMATRSIKSGVSTRSVKSEDCSVANDAFDEEKNIAGLKCPKPTMHHVPVV